MKNIIITLIWVGVVLTGAALTGCVTIEHGEFKYSRLGGQKLNDVAIKTPDGTVVTIGQQE